MDSFQHFCPEHIGMLIVIAAAITAGLLTVRKMSDTKTGITVILLSLATLAGEIVQDYLLVKEGGDLIGFLPLHMNECNNDDHHNQSNDRHQNSQPKRINYHYTFLPYFLICLVTPST